MEEETETSASSTGGIAIYIDSGSGYELSGSSKFPTTILYELNTAQSKCTNNGVISQDSVTKTVSVSVTSTDYCTLYYDKQDVTLSEYVISLADTETTPDFSTVATTDEGVFAMEDDYGELSYYFRGAVTNNYVYFAGYYWRIVRVNGDGTVRIIYDGSTSAYANGTSSTDRYISKSAFNSNSYSPAYVGYMYGDVTEDLKSSSTYGISMSSSVSFYYGSSYTYDASTGYYTLSNTTSGVWSSIYSSVISTYKYTCARTSTTCQYLYEITAHTSTAAIGYKHILSGTYDAITENKYDSTIKTTLDTWYKSNLLDTEYESYLADGIFCNDRSVYSGDGYSVAI